jgi:hypothetical protein
MHQRRILSTALAPDLCRCSIYTRSLQRNVGGGFGFMMKPIMFNVDVDDDAIV